jgi:hypothetical protein
VNYQVLDPFFISKVEGSFTITGRGFAVFPGVPGKRLPRGVRAGDKVELRRPDGTALQTEIAAIEHAKMIRGGSQWPIRFPADVHADDVPAGTEIWWMAPGPPKSAE